MFKSIENLNAEERSLMLTTLMSFELNELSNCLIDPERFDNQLLDAQRGLPQKLQQFWEPLVTEWLEKKVKKG